MLSLVLHIHLYILFVLSTSSCDKPIFNMLIDKMDPVGMIVSFAGAKAEDNIRLLVTVIASLLFAYPYSVISRKLSPTHQHLLNTITGIAFLYYCYGIGIIHLLFDICLIAVLLNVAGGTIGSVLFTWVWVFGHLLWGCSGEYLVDGVLPRSWTTAHCVLTLKLIGVATSLYDAKTGKKVDKKSSVDTMFTLTSSKIQVLEVMGFCCLFCTSIVGPQLSFRRYREFVNGTLYDREKVGGNMYHAINRAALAIFYIIIYILTDPYVPSTNYYASAEFAMQPYLKKLFLSGVFFFFLFRRWFIVWLIVEAACVSFGISYKTNKDGGYDWTADLSANVYQLEFATTGQEMALSINVSVHYWVVYYVYKRFKFVKSQTFSLFITMIFISYWHGVYPGFILTFINEVSIIKFERSLEKFFPRFIGDYRQFPLFIRLIRYMIQFVYLNVFIGSGMLPFLLLSLERTLLYWKAVHYFTPVVFFVELILSFLMDFFVQKFPQKV